MNLEKRVNGNGQGFLKRIVRKALPYVLATSLGLAVMGCQDPPGPISVQNTISPSTIPSGGNIFWEIEVTNYGNKVEIDQATVDEKVISGWAVGIYDFSMNLPITNTIINANSTEVIFSRSVPVYNVGADGSDIIFENIVTIASDGGDDSDTCTYTVVNSNSYSPLNFQSKSVEESPKVRGAIQTLPDYMGE